MLSFLDAVRARLRVIKDGMSLGTFLKVVSVVSLPLPYKVLLSRNTAPFLSIRSRVKDPALLFDGLNISPV